MNLKEKIKRILLGDRYNSSTYIDHLRQIGMKIGLDCTIYVPTKTIIDEQYPWMITIGNHVRITEGVKILTHDYAWSVLKTTTGTILGASGTVRIGDNVFIGMNTIITRNVEIGNNVIIGAGSVVTSSCDDNSIYAGVPARRIMSIEEYYEKREKAQLDEAKKLAIEYYLRYGKCPDKNVFHEYFMLFETSKEAVKVDDFEKKLELCENKVQSMEYMDMSRPMFNGYTDFMRYCFEEIASDLQFTKE